MKKVKVYNIVFSQSDWDQNALCDALQLEHWTDVSDTDLIEYLKQWDQNPMDQCDSNVYDADRIDTPFLGYRIDRRRTKSGYLLSRNNILGTFGLSYFELIEE